MHIFHVSSEVAPFAKVGGLADVVTGLSRHLVAQGHHVCAVLPDYHRLDRSCLVSQNREERFITRYAGVEHVCIVRYFTYDSMLSIVLFDTEDGYWQKSVDIYSGGQERFFFFCKAVRDWLYGQRVDVLHLHDWPTALLAFLCPEISTVLTMHNFAFQGWCQWQDLERVGIGRNEDTHALFKDPLGDCLNVVKAGLYTARLVTTVSQTYSREVLTPEYGCGLQDVLADIQDRFCGIVNGIDYGYWNPQKDAFLFEPYDGSWSISDVRIAKHENKKKLLENLGIPFADDKPLLVAITRLVEQKGIWLLHDLFQQAEREDFYGIILGSVPDERAAEAFGLLDRFLRQRGRGAVILENDEACAHRLYAAADLFVAPSLFEPCGLTQLIALRYGALPLVRKTGGFADTVYDKGVCANGFLFVEPRLEELLETVRRALRLYGQKAWEERMACGLQKDFSWQRSGDAYLEAYRMIVSAKG